MTMAIRNPAYPQIANTWAEKQTFNQGAAATTFYQSTASATNNRDTIVSDPTSDFIIECPGVAGLQIPNATDGWIFTHAASNNAITAGYFKTNNPPSSLAGTTGGTVYWYQPNQGTTKNFVAVLDAYENDTSTNQTITFPTPYSYNPAVSTNTTGLTVTATTTTLTIKAPNNTTVYNGVVEVVGI